MKVFKLYLYAYFLITTMNLICTMNLKLRKDKSEKYRTAALEKDFKPDQTPGVIKELLKKLKKQNSANSDVVEECIKLLVNNKNNDQMATLWTSIGQVMKSSTPKLIERQIFSDFIKSTSESVVVDQLKKECKEVVIEGIIEKGDVENPQKQKELRDIVSPYFTIAPTHNQKNIITAFIGVHRDTQVARDMIPKLNGNK